MSIGALLYAISNLGQEVMVKQTDTLQYLAQLGLWGLGISAAQVCVCVWRQLARHARAAKPSAV